MSNISSRDEYTSVRLSPSIQSELRVVVSELKKSNRSWSMSRILNLACMEFLSSIAQKNVKELDGLFDKYESLKIGSNKLR